MEKKQRKFRKITAKSNFDLRDPHDAQELKILLNGPNYLSAHAEIYSLFRAKALSSPQALNTNAEIFNILKQIWREFDIDPLKD